ncbi:unnamed protein product [Musa textilis]
MRSSSVDLDRRREETMKFFGVYLFDKYLYGFICLINIIIVYIIIISSSSSSSSSSRILSSNHETRGVREEEAAAAVNVDVDSLRRRMGSNSPPPGFEMVDLLPIVTRG